MTMGKTAGMSRSTLRLVLAVALAAAACGSEVAGPSGQPDPEPPPGEWSSQVLSAEPGADQPVLFGVDGEQVVTVVVGENGVVTGFATDDEGIFVAGEPTPTDGGFLMLGGVARLGDGWVALGAGGRETIDGDDQLTFQVRAFSSPDGRTWTEQEASGLGGPADVHDVVAGPDGGAVAVGVSRNGEDPGFGAFAPRAWSTTDGTSWTTVDLPTNGAGEGSVGAVARVGDRLLAVGMLDRAGAMWSSEDDGVTWTLAEPPGLPVATSLTDIVVGEDAVLVSGTGVAVAGSEDFSEGTSVLARSTDGGTTWAAVTQPPPEGGGEGYGNPVFGGEGGPFLTTTSTFIEAFRQPELCYADIDICRQDTSVVLYTSDDGDVWRRVDTSALGEGEAREVDGAVVAAEGRIVVHQWTEGGVRVSTWPAGVPLPGEDEPVLPEAALVTLDDSQDPEIGVRYAAPLYIHCGMDYLYLGDEPWERTDDGPDVETGAGDSVTTDWPVAQQTIFGYATRTDDETIEYSIGDDEVIATYAPATGQVPGCD